MLLLMGTLLGAAGAAVLGAAHVPAGRVRAAGSYTNAREFFETVDNRKHMEIYNGDIYYATAGRVASSGSSLKYREVGQDIEITGNGVSLQLAVKRDQTMQEISDVRAGGFEYVLYRISCQDLIRLARAKNSAVADSIFQAELVEVTVDSIMTTRSGSTLNGGVSERGDGSLDEWGAVYHLRDSGDLKTLRRVFAGHDFLNYIDIRKDIHNYAMQIRYNAAGGIPAEGYRTVKDSQGADILCRGEYPLETRIRLLQQETMVVPDHVSLSSSPNLKKTGYHLVSGRQWTYNNRYFDAHTAYLPREIHPEAGIKNLQLTMSAAWQPNTYTICYDANGGQGLMGDQQCTYDVDTALLAMAYTREGYTFLAWNTRADGSGDSYGREYENGHEKLLRNLTDVDQGVVTLYALWEPQVYQIRTVKDGGTGIYQGDKQIQGGADIFYEKYEQAWCGDRAGKQEISKIEVPALFGYEFLGYYTGISGMGAMVTDPEGSFMENREGSLLDRQVADKNIFRCDSLVYAHWRARQCRITFQKEGGYGGSDGVTAVYGEAMPFADGPVRDGWEFQGYYTQPGGNGTCYYNEHMAGNRPWDQEEDTVLYAFWKDTTAPTVTLTASAGIWTNRRICLTADAWDFGVGLDRVEIYQGSTQVAVKTGLSGIAESTLAYENPKEGAIRYKAVAYDLNGLSGEAWCTVYYDITAPKVSDRRLLFDGFSASDSLFVTDYVSIRER